MTHLLLWLVSITSLADKENGCSPRGTLHPVWEGKVITHVYSHLFPNSILTLRSMPEGSPMRHQFGRGARTNSVRLKNISRLPNRIIRHGHRPEGGTPSAFSTQRQVYAHDVVERENVIELDTQEVELRRVASDLGSSRKSACTSDTKVQRART